MNLVQVYGQNWTVPVFFHWDWSRLNSTTDQCNGKILYDNCGFLFLVLQQHHMFKCLPFLDLGHFGWNSKCCLIFIQGTPLIFLAFKVKAFLSLTNFFPLSCLGLGVRVVVWLYSSTTAVFEPPKIPPGLTNVNKDPERHQREVSSELKPHCIGSLWCPAVRKKLFCSTTRSISESQGDGGDQPWDF